MKATVWGVLAVSITIAIVTILAVGELSEGVFLALLIFVLFGAVLPAVALPIGGLILFAIIWRNAVVGKLASTITRLTSATAQSATPLPSFSPTFSGYTAPDTVTPYKSKS